MKTRLLFAIMIGAMFTANCQTTIPGGLVSGTWTAAGSPYLIQGSIQIPNDSTLVIQPGVTVDFLGTYKLLVLGRLLAIGTISDSIIFTCGIMVAGWRGIRFDGTPVTNDTSKIFYCRIQSGQAEGPSPDNNGGALYFSQFSKAIISNCRINECMASNDGGGIFCSYSNPVIANNCISNNTAGTNGGGILCIDSDPLIYGNTISNNSAYYGGGIYTVNCSPAILNNNISYNNATYFGGAVACISNATCINCNPTITGNTISHNDTYYGGGIYCEEFCNPTISNNDISYNTASDAGGIYCYINSNPVISNNIISFNTVDQNGGGIYCINYSMPTIMNNFISNNHATNGGGILCNDNPIISNNTISNNTASSRGGGINCYYSCSAITNNTISNNYAPKGGALFLENNSNPVLKNSILWGNTAGSSGAQVYLLDESCDPNFYYCDVQGGTAAFGLNNNFFTGIFQHNLDSDPLFVSPSGGSGTGFNGITADWSLVSASPCINAGDPAGSYPPTDIAGNPRINGSFIDIGAFEFQGAVGITNSGLQDQIIIMPNPFSNSAVIHLNFPADNADLTIYNMYGQCVNNIKNISSDPVILERENLNSGAYFYELKKNHRILAKGKFIITD